MIAISPSMLREGGLVFCLCFLFFYYFLTITVTLMTTTGLLFAQLQGW